VVDPLVGFLVAEEVRDKLNETGDMAGTTNELNELVDVQHVDFELVEDLLNRLKGTVEEVMAELLETRMGEVGIEVDTLEDRVGFDGGLGRGGTAFTSRIPSSIVRRERSEDPPRSTIRTLRPPLTFLLRP